MPSTVIFVETAAAFAAIADELQAAGRVAVDLEGNGLFAYRDKICTLQLAWEAHGELKIAVIDGLAVDLGLLKPLLESASPFKVVHDVAFDARMMHRAGISMASVHDTALAGAFLGRRSTGLRALLESELGVHVDKAMQLSDWSRRPLDADALGYLAADVEHLLALDDALWSEVVAAGIEDELITETDHRLRMACEPERSPAPAFVRIRGLERLDDLGKAVLKAVAEVREMVAEQRDVPPFKVVADHVLLGIARSRPRARDALPAAMRAADDELQERLLEAVRIGEQAGRLDPESEALLQRPKLDRAEAERRKRLEKRLVSWREAEAKRRGVHEQVVLPGHCLRRLAGGEARTAEQIAQVEGIGATRATRYADVLSALLQGEAAR